MALVLPTGLEKLMGMFGPFPEMNEDKLREAGDEYETVSGYFGGLSEAFSRLITEIRDNFQGESADAFTATMRDFVHGADYLGSARDGALQLAQFARDTANEVEYAKWTSLAMLIQLLAELAFYAATSWFNPAAEEEAAVAEAVTAIVIRTVLTKLLKAIVTHVALSAGMGVAMDVLIQLIQKLQGHRTSWSTSTTIQTLEFGVVAGAVGPGLGPLGKKLSSLLGDTFGKNLGKDLGGAFGHLLPETFTTVTQDGAKTFGDDLGRAFGEHADSLVSRFPPPAERGTGAGPRTRPAAGGDIPTSSTIGFEKDVAAVFERNLGGPLGVDVARRVGNDFAAAFARAWGRHDTGLAQVEEALTASLALHAERLGADGVKSLSARLPEAVVRTLAQHGGPDAIRMAAKVVASAAESGANMTLSQGLYGLIFDPSHTFTVSGETAGTGAAMGAVGRGGHVLVDAVKAARAPRFALPGNLRRSPSTPAGTPTVEDAPAPGPVTTVGGTHDPAAGTAPPGTGGAAARPATVSATVRVAEDVAPRAENPAPVTTPTTAIEHVEGEEAATRVATAGGTTAGGTRDERTAGAGPPSPAGRPVEEVAGSEAHHRSPSGDGRPGMTETSGTSKSRGAGPADGEAEYTRPVTTTGRGDTGARAAGDRHHAEEMVDHRSVAERPDNPPTPTATTGGPDRGQTPGRTARLEAGIRPRPPREGDRPPDSPAANGRVGTRAHDGAETRSPRDGSSTAPVRPVEEHVPGDGHRSTEAARIERILRGEPVGAWPHGGTAGTGTLEDVSLGIRDAAHHLVQRWNHYPPTVDRVDTQAQRPEREAAVYAVAHELATNGGDTARALAQRLGRKRGVQQPWLGRPGGSSQRDGRGGDSGQGDSGHGSGGQDSNGHGGSGRGDGGQGGDGRRNDRQGGGGHDGGGRRPRRVSDKKQADAIDAIVKEHTSKYSFGRTGRAPSMSRLRFRRSIGADERAGRTLYHLSLMMYDTIRALHRHAGNIGRAELEVQGMLINDRLVFASNHDRSMELLGGYADRLRGDRPTMTLTQLLALRTDEVVGRSRVDRDEYRDRLNRAITKTRLAAAGRRSADPASRVLQGQGDVLFVNVRDSRLHALLTSPEHAGHVIILHGGLPRSKGVHAEQRLLIALDVAGIAGEDVVGPHVIMGKFRPCFGCWAALSHYRDCRGFNSLQFNPNFGRYYRDALDSTSRFVRDALARPSFRQRVEDALQGEQMSSSALSWQQPPPDARERNGQETLIPTRDAPVDGYNTASDSEAETEEDTTTGTWSDRPRRTRSGKPYDAKSGTNTMGAPRRDAPGRSRAGGSGDKGKTAGPGGERPVETTEWLDPDLHALCSAGMQLQTDPSTGRPQYFDTNFDMWFTLPLDSDRALPSPSGPVAGPSNLRARPGGSGHRPSSSSRPGSPMDVESEGEEAPRTGRGTGPGQKKPGTKKGKEREHPQ